MIFVSLGYSAKTVSAAELLTNGSFETGNFTGWTIANAAGSWMDWQNNVSGAGGGFNPPYVTAPQAGTRSVWNGVTATANQQYSMYQQVTIPAGQLATLQWKDRFQMNLADFCTSPASCGQAFYFVEVTNTSNVVLQTLYSVTAPALAKIDTGWVTHTVNLSAYAGQTIRIRFRDYATATFAGPGQAEIDAVSLNAFVPTAAGVSVGGRVLDSNGNGLARQIVGLTDGAGSTRTTVTNSFGGYRFDEVRVGETYIVTVVSKKFLFTDSPRAISVQDELTAVDFMAGP